MMQQKEKTGNPQSDSNRLFKKNNIGSYIAFVRAEPGLLHCVQTNCNSLLGFLVSGFQSIKCECKCGLSNSTS